MTQPRLPSMSAPGPLKSAALTVNPLAHMQEKEQTSWNELWSKFRWAIGSTYGLSYTKRSEVGEAARTMALHLVAENGLPTSTG